MRNLDPDLLIKHEDYLEVHNKQEKEKFEEVDALERSFIERKHSELNPTEKRKYNSLASARHREKVKKTRLRDRQIMTTLKNEIARLEREEINLEQLEKSLRSSQVQEMERWSYYYLYLQNESLRCEVNNIQKQKYLLTAVMKIKLLYPKFDATQFYKVIERTVFESLKVSTSFQETHDCKIKYNNKILRCANGRREIRKGLNQRLQKQKFNMHLKVRSLCIDESMKKFLRYRYKISGIRYDEFAFITYHLCKTNEYNPGFIMNFNIQYDIIDLSSVKLPLDRTRLGADKNILHQEYNISYVRPKGADMSFLVLSGIIIKKEKSIVIKTAVIYDKEANAFVPVDSGITCVTFDKSIRKIDETDVCVTSTTNASDRLRETIQFFKASFLLHKKQIFNQTPQPMIPVS
eukprot:augustus_masked-scaffold_2-processed-gene-6.38-mRNA-1 protein AED:1.00 eAED:1.00 QI:0/-1/0/0/-1/1/1/0/405